VTPPTLRQMKEKRELYIIFHHGNHWTLVIVTEEGEIYYLDSKEQALRRHDTVRHVMALMTCQDLQSVYGGISYQAQDRTHNNPSFVPFNMASSNITHPPRAVPSDLWAKIISEAASRVPQRRGTEPDGRGGG
jgi:Ulp1 protease family, C-terminal catalytic domain